MKKILVSLLISIILAPMFMVLMPRVEGRMIGEDESVRVCLASGIEVNKVERVSGTRLKAPEGPGIMAAAYIDLAHTGTANNQYDFDRWVDLYVDVDASPGPITVDVFTYLETPNNDIIDSSSYYGWVVQGTVDDYKWFSMYNGYDYMQYVGLQWHIEILVRDSSTYVLLDQKKVFFYVGPIMTDHFTCRDPYNAYATRTTIFYDTETAWEYTAWDTHNLWITYEVKWDFNGPGTSHLIAGPADLTPGQSSLWVAGGITGGAPGSWYVDVLLDDKFRARDGFDIIATTSSVTVDPNGGRIYVDESPIPITVLTVYTWSQGSTHTLDPDSGYSPIDGKRLIFSHWSDGNTADPRTITAPSGSATYRAEWQTQFRLVINVNPSGGGTTNPAIGTYWYNSGSSQTVNETPNPGYAFSYWNLDGSNVGSGTSYAVTMNTNHALTAVFTVLIPDFDIWTNPASVSVECDSSDIITIYTSSINDFNEDILLSVTDPPTGVTLSFSKNPVHPPAGGQDSSTLTFSVDSNTPHGTYYPKVVGTSSSKIHDFGIELEITGIEVTCQIVIEPDGRITPGDRIEYSVNIHNAMQIQVQDVDVTLSSPSGTPIGFEVTYKSYYTDSQSQNYETILAGNDRSKFWQLQIWKTITTPFYPGQIVPRINILDPVPIGTFEVTILVEWFDENGFHQKSESLPITIEYPDFGPPPTGYEHYVGSSSYYHVDDVNVNRASAKAICGTDDYASDSPLLATVLLRLWVRYYWVKPHDLELLLWGGRVSDITTLTRMKNSEKCGFCLQCSEVTVSLTRSLNIPARVVVGELQFWGFLPRGHEWLEAYFDNHWVHIDPSIGEVSVDSSEPFEGYVDHKDITGVTIAAACKVTDCPHYAGHAWSKPWIPLTGCPDFSTNWEIVTSKYNPYTDSVTGTVILIREEGHFLGMDVYDSMGRHVKIDFQTNSTLLEISGSCYIIDWNYSAIFLPANTTDFDVVVDARYAEQPVETYNLTCSIIVDSTIASEVSYQSTINASGREGYHCQITNQTVEFTPGLHRLALLNLEVPKTFVGQGYNLTINTYLENHGDFSEICNVTFYANSTVIGKKAVYGLPAGQSVMLAFTWNSTDCVRGSYIIKAVIDPVPGEVDTTDNSFVDGIIYISIPGDINGDKKVDMRDIGIQARAYSATPSSPNWQPNADITEDEVVDMHDIGIAARNYGKSW